MPFRGIRFIASGLSVDATFRAGARPRRPPHHAPPPAGRASRGPGRDAGLGHPRSGNPAGRGRPRRGRGRVPLDRRGRRRGVAGAPLGGAGAGRAGAAVRVPPALPRRALDGRGRGLLVRRRPGVRHPGGAGRGVRRDHLAGSRPPAGRPLRQVPRPGPDPRRGRHRRAASGAPRPSPAACGRSSAGASPSSARRPVRSTASPAKASPSSSSTRWRSARPWRRGTSRATRPPHRRLRRNPAAGGVGSCWRWTAGGGCAAAGSERWQREPVAVLRSPGAPRGRARLAHTGSSRASARWAGGS